VKVRAQTLNAIKISVPSPHRYHARATLAALLKEAES
jgi:hypothetical protein